MDVPQVPPGKSILRVEAPGGYSDRFLFEPLGCVNVGGFFKPSNGKAAKGHYPVRKKKSGMVLSPLIKANPDVIIITGDVFAVQKALSRTIMKNPALAAVPAIKNLDIYSLPFYADSSVIQYPAILERQAVALAR